jgi:hypothetical protein
MSREQSSNGVLTEYMVLAKTRSNSVSTVKALNMWGFHLRDISIVEQMPNLEVVALPINEIADLSPFRNCPQLRELRLRQNYIADFEQLRYLQDLAALQNLSLTGNPITELPRYRQTVIAMLPQLSKLDDEDIHDADRAARRSSSQPQLIYEPETDQRHCRPAARRDPPSRQTRRDQAALTAVLALLPDLTPASLRVVLQAILDAQS